MPTPHAPHTPPRAPGLLAAIIVLLLAATLGGGAWWLSGERVALYTDGATIRQRAGTASPRAILWSSPEPLAPPVDDRGEEYEPRLTPDGQRLFFVRGRPGHNADIFIAHRARDGWKNPQPLALNTEHDELGPTPSADGRSLYFASNRPGGLGGYDIWVASINGDAVGEPSNLGPAVNTSFNEYSPAPSPDDASLWFASNRPARAQHPAPHAPEASSASPDIAGRDRTLHADSELDASWRATLREHFWSGDYDLYAAPLALSPTAPPHTVDVTPRPAGPAKRSDQLSTDANDGAPAFSPAGDFLYFASDRPGGIGGFDLYRARITNAAPAEPQPLGEPINTAANELDPSISALGFELHFSSDRPGRQPSADRTSYADAVTDGYGLWRAESREVYLITEAREARWHLLLPYLPWLLLLALLALLLALLRRISSSPAWQQRWRTLSLLARCIIASLLLHALLAAVFAAWQVKTSLDDMLRTGSGAKVRLVSSEVSDGVAGQIRAALTNTDVHAPAPEPIDSPNTLPADRAPTDQPNDPAARTRAQATATPRPTPAIEPAGQPAHAELVSPSTPPTAQHHATRQAAHLPESTRSSSQDVSAADWTPAQPIRAAQAPSAISAADATPTTFTAPARAAAADPSPSAELTAPSLQQPSSASDLPQPAPPDAPGAAPTRAHAPAMPEAQPADKDSEPAPSPLHARLPVGPMAASSDAALDTLPSRADEIITSDPGRAGIDAQPTARHANIRAAKHTDDSALPAAHTTADLSTHAPEAPRTPIRSAALPATTAPPAAAPVADAAPSADPPTRLRTLGGEPSSRALDYTADNQLLTAVDRRAAPPREAAHQAASAPLAAHEPSSASALHAPEPARSTPAPRSLILPTLDARAAARAAEPSAELSPPSVIAMAGTPAPALDLAPDEPALAAPRAARAYIDASHHSRPAEHEAPASLPIPWLPRGQPEVPGASAAVPTPRLPTEPPKREAVLAGIVIDARTRQPIPGAEVRLDQVQGARAVQTGPDGTFAFLAPDLPEQFAVAATRAGYTPGAASMAADDALNGRRMTIALDPILESVIALEAEPRVHHLGNDSFSGRVNSQFQKPSEGTRYTQTFTLRPDQLLPPTARAELRMLAKGAQLDNQVIINGRRLSVHLTGSPDDGSYGPIRLPIPLGALRPGDNTLEIQAVQRQGTDIDDFEFINIQLHLLPDLSEPQNERTTPRPPRNAL